MSYNAIGFQAFTAARENASFVYVRPYGIWHKGAAYWDAKIPRKKGTVVRIAEDTSGGILSLMVFTIDGEFLCSAYPLDWCEGEHPVQIEIMAEWNALSPAEQKRRMEGSEGQ